MFNLWLNVVTEFSEKWYVRKYFYMLQILITIIKQQRNSITSCITSQIQPIIKYKTHFMRVIKCRQFFCAPDIFLYIPENSGQIQPVVVFCCKYNVIIRIWTNIQPMVEFGLGFLMFITFWIPHHITTSECYVWIFSSFNVMVHRFVNHNNVQPVVECCDRIQRKMIYVKCFYMLQILTTTRKQWLYSTTSCVTQQIQPIIKYKTHFMQATKRG